MFKPATVLIIATCLLGQFTGCNQSRREEIRPAVKPSSDASAIANEAWVLMNQLDQMLYQQQLTHWSTDQREERIHRPLRELSTRWRLEVKMSDSVAEGQYALCRKSLVDLDAWARDFNIESAAERQATYERDKAICQHALKNPQLGNSIIQQ